MENWYIYVLECNDKSYYCGITKDIKRRIHEHNFTKKASKYVKTKRPAELIYISSALNKSDALIYEKKFKKLNKIQKNNLINSSDSNIKNFFNNS